jgi:DNA-binding SARP family transcriptional activator
VERDLVTRAGTAPSVLRQTVEQLAELRRSAERRGDRAFSAMVGAADRVAEELQRCRNKTLHCWRDYERAVDAEDSTTAQYKALLSVIGEFAEDVEAADRGTTEQAGARARGRRRLFGWVRRANATPGRILERTDEAAGSAADEALLVAVLLVGASARSLLHDSGGLAAAASHAEETLPAERDRLLVPAGNMIAAHTGLDEISEETDEQPDDDGASQCGLGRFNGEPAELRGNVVAADLVLHLLGPVRVFLDGRPISALPGGQSLRVMRYLLAHYDRAVPVEVLIETFWPGTSLEAGRRNLQQTVYVLRKTLRSDRHEQSVLFESNTYRVNPALSVWSDVTAFERAAASGRRAENEGRVAQARNDFALAERCYDGDYLEDSPYEEWAIDERERLRLLYVDVGNRLAEQHLAADDVAATLAVSRRVLCRDPCDENAHRRIMRCYGAAGRRNMLIRQYRRCVASLETMYGIGPSPETIRLYESLIAD